MLSSSHWSISVDLRDSPTASPTHRILLIASYFSHPTALFNHSDHSTTSIRRSSEPHQGPLLLRRHDGLCLVLQPSIRPRPVRCRPRRLRCEFEFTPLTLSCLTVALALAPTPTPTLALTLTLNFTRRPSLVTLHLSPFNPHPHPHPHPSPVTLLPSPLTLTLTLPLTNHSGGVSLAFTLLVDPLVAGVIAGLAHGRCHVCACMYSNRRPRPRQVP